MSTNNLPKPIGAINEDSIMSNSTNNSFTDTLIQDIPKIKNIFFISKAIEPKIIDILLYLQSDTNLAVNKIQIIKYLQSLFLNVEFNSEIFFRKFINEPERLNLYQIIIYQYVLYTNSGNTKAEEDSYRSELHNLFILLLSQITVERETYRYILSFLIYFLNKKNITASINKKMNMQSNNEILDEPIINLNSEHLYRVLELLRIFYKYLQTYNEIPNFFFFSGESDSNITIPNKENPNDHNKKLLNLDDTLCIMLFIKPLPTEYIKAVYPKIKYRLFELRFNDKNKKTLSINIDIDNKINANNSEESLQQLLVNETNCVLIKCSSNRKKKIINSEIFVGLNRFELPPIKDDKENEKGSKFKDEIKEIVLFKNFIGICSNIIIYKEKKNDGLPKFLFSLEENTNKLRQSSKEENINNPPLTRKRSAFFTKSIFPNGIFSEELYSYFTKIDLKDQVDQNILSNTIKINNEQKININDFKDFLNNNLIAIYMPTRVDIPSQYEDRTLSNSPQLILRDSINNLDAEFNTRSPWMNGVHTYSSIKDDFNAIGGLSNLLPIIELMTNNSEFLTENNFSLFLTIISNFVFSPLYQKALMKETHSNFFKNLSYFLEKMPDKFFNNQLIDNFKLILAFLYSGNGTDFLEMNKQFHNYILINEKILFKFNEEDQKSIISSICLIAGNKNMDLDIVKIIKIMLNYDRKKNFKFCCKNHAYYFNENYPIMDSELSNRIQPIEKLIEIIFEKKYILNKEKIKSLNNVNNSHNKVQTNKSMNINEENLYENNNLYLLFYLLTLDISPCLQKSIICILTNIITKYNYETFIKMFDKKEELFDIVLFVFKISIFDVKIYALNLLFLIEKNNKGKNLNNNDKKIFFKNEILPFFLLDEINTLPAKKFEESNELKDNKEEEQNNQEKSEIKKEENNNDKNKGEQKDISITNEEKKIEDDNIEINKINNDNEIIKQKKVELEYEILKSESTEENKEQYGIKTETDIDGIKYFLFSSTDVQRKIYEKYNKKKYYSLLNDIYEKVLFYFNDKICINFKLNLLIEIVSNGDLLLIQSFISKLYEIYNQENDKGKEKEKEKEKEKDQEKGKKESVFNGLFDNQNLLHWLLETSFQIYILINSDKDKSNNPFFPGFSLDIYKNSNNLEQLEKPYDDHEKKEIFQEILKKCKDIIKYILNQKIQRFDYILSWSKYYLELKKENNIFDKMKAFINDFIQDMLNGPNITTFSEQIFLNNPKAKHTLYYINMFFEYFTYYKLDYNKSFFEKEKNDNKIKLIKKVSQDLKYILFNQRDKGIIIDPKKELELFEQKIDDYLFMRIVFLICSPIWSGNEKKSVKNENEIYLKYIVGNNKNCYITELEILFYSFGEEYLEDTNYCNKGIPLIIIIYHLFISFLNVGGNKTELDEYFKDLRALILLIIISSSTLNSSEMAKKKKWPKEEQYKDIQFIVECILFNILFFLYNRIKSFKKEINEYKTKIEKENVSETEKNENIENMKKNLDYLNILNKIYAQNLGYFLKILNKIYRGVKSEEMQKKGMLKFFKNIFKSQAEGVKKSGAFLLMEKIYNESPKLSLSEANNINNNNFRNTLAETSQTNPMDLIEKNKEKENNKEEIEDRKKKSKNRSLRIGHNTNVDLNNYLTNPNPDITPIKSQFISKKTQDPKEINNLIEENSNSLEVKDLNIDNNKIINNTNEENYLDKICKILFTPKDVKEINLDDKNFEKLEKYINEFLNDKNIQMFYENHYEEYNKDLYPFISFIEKRLSTIEKIIPIYDNRKNLSKYPLKLCLVPYYYPENKYQTILIEKIQEKNEELKEEIRLNKKKNEIEEYFICKNYRNIKKELFKFNGIWSYQEYFYNNESYKLKYKLLNHFTNDFTKIMMTPIIDIDYYLPKFSLFKGEIFRNNEKMLIPIAKTTDLCIGLTDKNNKIINANNMKDSNKDKEIPKTENKLETSANSATSFDSLNNSSTSNIGENKQDNNNIPLYELNVENYPFLKEAEIKEKEILASNESINNFNEKDYNIFIDYIKKKHFNKKGYHCFLSEACLVKLPFHIRGIIYINNEEIGFYSYETKREGNEEDFDGDKKVCFGSVFKGQGKRYNHYYMKMPFEEIELVFKRRYYFKKNALEFFTQSKKSYFFRIDEANFKSFLDNMKYHLKNDLEDITIDYSKFEEKIGFINKNNALYNYNNYNILFNTKKYSSIKFLYLKWVRWEVSTFTLLNAMNIYANRSYNDINQYPVFPWIITDYTSKVLPNFDNSNANKNANQTNTANNNNTPNPSENRPLIRPFSTPMGMIDITEEAKERKENYKEHWESLENDDDKDDNYDRYGSHYSTSLYLTYYLVRVFPFSYIRIELQGKSFDDPNRLFNSLSNSFECAITQKSDLRELIPEFFCLPEMFYNLNNLNLGEVVDDKTKESVLVNNIELPPWASGDAYIFIKKHRELLESVEISEKINDWFNIIFGSKQKGKAAKNIGNLFIRQTYEDFDETHKNADQNERIYQNRMVEFGVTPSQLFKNDTYKRYAIKDLKKKPILFNYQIKANNNINEELEVKDSELFLEGTPYKIFSSLKKNEDVKNEKILFLYEDKIKIISKTNEKGFFIKSKSENKFNKINMFMKNKDNKENKNQDVKENKNNKEIEENKETKEKKDNEEAKEDTEKKEEKENEKNDENANKMNKEIENENNNNYEEETGIKDEEDNKNSSNKETISKYDKVLISPKYRMNSTLAPTIIYDKGNYIALGGFWNGNILIHKLDDFGSKKDKSQKNINIISTNDISPITHMIIDLSETFVICANKIGTIYIFKINKDNKGYWTLHKTIQDNQREITSIDLNENLNVFVTCDKEGYINLYTLPNCKLINSYKLNEKIFQNNNPNCNNETRTGSNITINNSLNSLYADQVIIFNSPLASLIFYIKSRKSLCVFSINFHFIKEISLRYEIVPNGIKKYTDYFSKDYLFIYNSNDKTIDVYDLIDLNINIIAKSSKINYTFVDFNFSKEMDHALIMVKNIDDKKNECTKDKNEQRNYKILILKSPGRGDIKLF